MSHPILNLDSVEVHPMPPAFAATGDAAQRYAPRLAMIGAQLGAQKLGCNLIALSPGKRAFPFHSHRVNEEMFLVTEGRGEIRIGAARHPLRQGDIVVCPAGGPETAHQIINTGEVELRYLALSTRLSPDIAEFPDSGKYRVFEESSSAEGQIDGFNVLGRKGESVDYWEGE